MRVTVDGVLLMTVSQTTSITILSMTGGAVLDNFLMRGGSGTTALQVDELTVDVLQPSGTYPHPGAPTVRASQKVTEVITLPDDSFARMSQGVIELVLKRGPSGALIRITKNLQVLGA